MMTPPRLPRSANDANGWRRAPSSLRFLPVIFSTVTALFLIAGLRGGALAATRAAPVEVPRAIAAHPRAAAGYQLLDQLPNFRGKDQYDNKVKLSDFRGKYVMLEFSAWWCGPCKLMAMWVAELRKKMSDAGVPFEFVTVIMEGFSAGSGQSTRKDAEMWSVMSRDTGPVLYNPYNSLDARTADLWQTFYNLTFNAFPTVVILDPEGRILASVANGYTGQDLYDFVHGTGVGPQLFTDLPTTSDAARASSPLDHIDVELALNEGTDGATLSTGQSAPLAIPLVNFPVVSFLGSSITDVGPNFTVSATVDVSLINDDLPAEDGHLILSNPTTTLYGGTRPLGRSPYDPYLPSSGMQYCQKPGVNCDFDAPEFGLSFFSDPTGDFHLDPAASGFADPQLPLDMDLFAGSAVSLRPPGVAIESLGVSLLQVTGSSGVKGTLVRYLQKALHEIPKGTACSRLGKLSVKLTSWTAAGLMLPADSQHIQDAMTQVKDFLACP